MLRTLRIALRGLRREWRAGELRALAGALMVAVGSVTAVGFFTDRMQRAMLSGASELLGADLRIESGEPLPERLQASADALELQSARTLAFSTALAAGERFELASLKAVDANYPLRGVMRISDAPFAPDRPAEGVPAPGTAWLDARLASVLGLAVGERIDVGASRLRVDAILSYEPDRGGDVFNIAPRLMINLADVPGSGLVQAGSRVDHHLLVAGAEAAVDAYRDAVAPTLAANQQLEGVRDARPELRAALDRARRFLGLAALVSVLLAGAAVAVSARRYAEKHMDGAAVMRCLGASQSTVLGVHALQVLVLGLLGSGLGCALGFAAQAMLAGAISELLRLPLPPAGFTPVIYGMVTGLVTLAGFALPPLIQLRRVPPSRVLRRDLAPAAPATLAVYGAALLAIGALVWAQAGEAKLASLAIAGAIGTVLLLAGAASLLVSLLGGLRARVGVSWRFGFANVARRAGGSVAQVSAFGLGITMLLLLGIVRSDLLEAWQANLPADTPNYFLINIQPDEVDGVQRSLAQEGLESTRLYPMVRGRLVAIGDRRVTAGDYPEPRAQRLAARDFNLSFADSLQADNRVVEGRFWRTGDTHAREFSVEQGIAETLGIEVGDDLTFLVAGSEVSARVTSLRQVEWDSFRVNFFVISPVAVLEDSPATWITSFHLPDDRRAALLDLVTRFPSITVIDIDALLSKVRQIVEHASVGVEYVFAFTLLAGFTVLFAAIQATLDERRYEAAVLRTLGANRNRLLAGLLAEFFAIGALAGLLAACAAALIGMVVAREIFELRVMPSPWLWLVGMFGGGLGVGLVGVLGTHRVLRQPPLGTLRAG